MVGWGLQIVALVLLVAGVSEAVRHGRDPAAFARDRCVADEGAPRPECVRRWTDRSSLAVFGRRAWPVIPLFAAGQLVQAVGMAAALRAWNRDGAASPPGPL